jgi:hypothetical protein
MEDTMKKTIVSLLIIGLAFFLGSCNDPTGGPVNPGGGDGDPTDVIFTWGQGDTGAFLNLRDDTGSYPGRSIPLADCPNKSGPTEGSPYVLGDISFYGEVTLHAILYDEDENEIELKEDGLAQFSLLPEGITSWANDDDKIAESYNLRSRTDKSTTPKTGKTGKPESLVVQGSYGTHEIGKVAKVRVQKLTLKLRTDLPSFEVVFGDSYVSTSGNKITFTNGATNSNHAALFRFPDTFPSLNNLTGKKLVFNYTAVDTDDTDDTKEYQIHIQAANGLEDYNGLAWDAEHGQFFVTLDVPESQFDQTYDAATKTGIFKIDLDKLIASSQVPSGPSNYHGPFDLTAVRILNNGTIYEAHIRKTAYSVIFDSITVE